MYQAKQEAEDLSTLIASIEDIFRCTSYQVHSEVISEILSSCEAATDRCISESLRRCREDCRSGQSMFSYLEPDHRHQIGSWLDHLCERGLRFASADLANAVMESCDSSRSLEARYGLVPS